MSTFKAVPDDLDELARMKLRQTLRRGSLYPLGALAVAGVTWLLVPSVALIACGAAIAWALSLYWSARDAMREVRHRFAWLLEDVSLRIDEVGVECANQWGSGLLRWADDVEVHSLDTCFVLRDSTEIVMVLPKRYLETQELLALNSRKRSGS